MCHRVYSLWALAMPHGNGVAIAAAAAGTGKRPQALGPLAGVINTRALEAPLSKTKKKKKNRNISLSQCSFTSYCIRIPNGKSSIKCQK
jgi:hypothetical protein